MTEGPLSGLRILIAEDEFFLASELADAVRREGGEVAAMAASAEDAGRQADQQIDGAILDVRLRERMSFDLARRLRSRGVPFFFMTGFGNTILPDDLTGATCLAKPLSLTYVVRKAAATFAPGGSDRPSVR